MKRVFIFPTVEEATGFLLTETREAVFVGGVGQAEIAAAVAKAVKAKKPHLIILAGVAGAYEGEGLEKGEVVEVVTERVAGIPERYAHSYETSADDLGLRLVAGITVNRSGEGVELARTLSGSETVDSLPIVENMEGAAFFALCEALGVAGCQIRAISNIVGEPFEQWEMQTALSNLTQTLTRITAKTEE